MTREIRKAAIAKARCPWCRRGGRSLTAAGALRRHLPYTKKFSGEYVPVCEGSSRAPREFFEQKRNAALPAPLSETE
jgi:hypothetical protein